MDLSRMERLILTTLVRVQYATHKQLNLLLPYKETSYPTIRRRTAQLREKKLLFAEPRWTNKPTRWPEQIFTYTDRARELLVPDFPELDWFTVHNHIHEAFEQPHKLGITDCVIAFQQFIRSRPEEVVLTRGLHHLILDHKPILPKGGVMPDFWFDLWVKGDMRRFWLEFDRNKENKNAWKEKVRRIVAIYEAAMDYFDAPGFTIMVVIRAENQAIARHRLEMLKAWTEAVLTQEGKEEWGQVFLFTDYDPAVTDPDEFFLTRIWDVPFDTLRQALIPDY